MILYELLKRGQFPIKIDANDNNYPKINYTVPENKTIQFKFSSPHHAQDELQRLKTQLISDLTTLNLQENTHYIINDQNTITLNSAGYELLQQRKAENDALADALSTPQKIMTLGMKKEGDEDNEDDNDDEEIDIADVNNAIDKVKIVKDILENKDSHLTTEGSLGRTSLCFHVREEYKYISEELFKALRIALNDLEPEDIAQPFEIDSATLEKPNINITISQYSSTNSNNRGEQSVMNTGPLMQQLINSLTGNDASPISPRLAGQTADLNANDFEVISGDAIRLKPSGYLKLKKINVDIFFQRETAILTKFTEQENGVLQLNIQPLHITPSNGSQPLSRSNGHKSLYLSDMSNILRNSIIAALKKKPPSDIIIKITDFDIQRINTLTITKNNHISLLHSLNKKILIADLVLIILQIKNHEQKINAFAKNGSIVNAFKKHTDIYELDDLFHILLSMQSKIDIHQNPIRDKLFFWNNTNSWQQLIAEIREYAYQQVVQKIATLDKTHAMDLIDSCLRKAIFTTHRSNNKFNWLHSTDSVKKLEKLREETDKRDHTTTLIQGL